MHHLILFVSLAVVLFLNGHLGAGCLCVAGVLYLIDSAEENQKLSLRQKKGGRS